MTYNGRIESFTGSIKKEKYIMNHNIITQAAILGITIAAAAVLLLSFRSGVTMESILGFGIVFALLRGAAMDYRHDGKRSLGR